MRRVSTRSREPPQAPPPHLLSERTMRQQVHLLGLCQRAIPLMIIREATSLCLHPPPKDRTARTTMGAAPSPQPIAFSSPPMALGYLSHQRRLRPRSSASTQHSLPPLPHASAPRTVWSGEICRALET